jgi:hypothetical protein
MSMISGAGVWWAVMRAAGRSVHALWAGSPRSLACMNVHLKTLAAHWRRCAKHDIEDALVHNVETACVGMREMWMICISEHASLERLERARKETIGMSCQL